jgi:hypothetical protein
MYPSPARAYATEILTQLAKECRDQAGILALAAPEGAGKDHPLFIRYQMFLDLADMLERVDLGPQSSSLGEN